MGFILGLISGMIIMCIIQINSDNRKDCIKCMERVGEECERCMKINKMVIDNKKHIPYV